MPRFLLRLYWAFRIPWHALTGRLFIFRDAPTWVCAEYALLEDDEDEDMRSLAAQAIAELHLRIDKIRRDIERALAQSNEGPTA